LIGLTADVDIDPSTDLLGKTIEDLQSGVTVNNRRKTISGNIKYVTGYTGFSGDPAEQEGNYLTVHFATEAEDTTIAVAIIGGDHGPVTLDPDGILVARIKNTDQKLQVTATKDGAGSDTVVYTLRGLNLANS
jgi:hypothetical protein